MKRNVGNTDRFVRIIFGIIFLLLFLSNVIDSGAKWAVLGVSVILIVTSFATFCPLYAVLGKNTCEVRKKK
jgi:hypothetical protein